MGTWGRTIRPSNRGAGAWMVGIVVGPLIVAAAPAPSDGWYQAAGGPDKPSSAALDLPLDVVGARTLAEPGEELATLTSIGFVGTARGLAAVAYTAPAAGEVASICWLVLAPHLPDIGLERLELGPCRGPGSVLGFDPLAETLFLCTPALAADVPQIRAVDGATLRTRWALTPAGLGLPSMPGSWHCGLGAIDPASEELVVPFFQSSEAFRPNGAVSYVASVDTHEGVVRWIQPVAMARELEVLGLPRAPGGDSFVADAVTLLPLATIVAGSDPAWGRTAYMLDRSGGFLGGYRALEPDLGDATGEPARQVYVLDAGSRWAAGSGGVAALALGNRLRVIDPNNPLGGREAFVGQGPFAAVTVGPGPAWGAGTIVVPGFDALWGRDATSLAERWVKVGLPGPPVGLVIVPPGNLFVLHHVSRGFLDGGPAYSHVLDRLDLGTGELRQRLELPGRGGFVSGLQVLPGQNGMLAWFSNGNVTWLGPAPAGLLPSIRVSDRYPRPGGPVSLALEAAQGTDPQGFQVSWGDSPPDLVEPGRPASHTYRDSGLYTIHATAHYADGRTATATLTVDVGGSPPPHLNFMQRAFSPERQDMTWGIIGLVVALAGAFLAVAARRRRHGRLRRELDTVERAFLATREEPAACETRLLDCRSRARQLLLDRRLDEGQYGIVTERIDELRRNLRVGLLESEFSFLPIGIARALEKYLADGNITAWERDRFVEALQADRVLIPEQKRQVQALVDEWFVRDRAAAD